MAKAAAAFLVGLLICVLVMWGVWLILGMMPIFTDTIRTVVMIILLIVGLVFLLGWLRTWPGGGVLP